MATQNMRISVSIPKNLRDETDEIANAKHLSRSKLISECLEKMVEKEKRALLIEGYKAMAKEHSDFAELSMKAAKEVLPPWE